MPCGGMLVITAASTKRALTAWMVAPIAALAAGETEFTSM
jgi:hypothetical protein